MGLIRARCIRDCYDSAGCKLYERAGGDDGVYTINEEDMKDKDLLRYFEEVEDPRRPSVVVPANIGSAAQAAPAAKPKGKAKGK
jgi:hypothetical protein